MTLGVIWEPWGAFWEAWGLIFGAFGVIFETLGTKSVIFTKTYEFLWFFVDFEGRSDHFGSLGDHFWGLGAHFWSPGYNFRTWEVQHEHFPSPRRPKVSLFLAPVRFSCSQDYSRGSPRFRGWQQSGLSCGWEKLMVEVIFLIFPWGFQYPS